MNPSAEALSWALVHFIWQGAALALVAFFAMRWLRLPAEGRYVAGIFTLAAMLASPIVTYAVLVRPPAPGSIVSGPTGSAPEMKVAPTGPVTDAEAQPVAATRGPDATMVLLAAWLCGVAVLSMRLAGGWIVARRMVTRRVRPVTPEIALLARRVAARMALDRAVRIIESSSVAVPVMVGWLKPVVLLPAVAVSGLTPTQIEALIAHELAHVRRHDYFVNLLQAAVETLLFYHPAVWWVSKQVRAEREHCCDDVAVGVCDRLVYVSALSDLAAMSVPTTALAATGGSLLTRVRRILGPGDSPASTGGGVWIPALVALVVIGAAAPALISNATNDASSGARTENVAVIESQGGGPGGVPGGVPTGVPGGVPGGAPGGVSSGVPGGVSGGVPGGIAYAWGIDQSAATARDLQALMERLKELSNDQQVKRELERIDHAHTRLELETRQQLESAKLELDGLQQQHIRLKQLHEKGLVTAEVLEQLEQRMREVELSMKQAREQMELQISDLMRSQQALASTKLLEEQALVRQALAEYATAQQLSEIDKTRLLELLAQARETRERQLSREQQSELERQMRGYQQAVEAYKRALDQGSEPRVREARGRAEELLRESGMRAAAGPVIGATETIRSGDVLSVEISGEDDLPPYYVRSDGTVRLPILGAIKVAGLTTEQARQTIAKQVSRVNASAKVGVSVQRPRTEERRQR
jgi:beta-lactamase regulating signal transducer with metallopeptidase domain